MSPQPPPDTEEALRQGLIDYLRENGGAPAFEIKPQSAEDEDLARTLEKTLPTLAELFLHPDCFEPGGPDELKMRPWVDALLACQQEALDD